MRNQGPGKEVGTLYRVSGEVLEVLPINGREFQLEELQTHVGGFIELIPGTARAGNPSAYCNEEGRLNGLRVNVEASKKFRQELVGDVIQVRKDKS